MWVVLEEVYWILKRHLILIRTENDRKNNYTLSVEFKSLFYNYLWITKREKRGRVRGRSRERRERGGGDRQTDIDLFFHLLTQSLVDSCMCPDQD